jgi:predicted short-subunit dehydrogenase-like oxidoreductase (DUF2520 family)
MKNETVAIIGAGRVGGAVGFLLAEAGYRVTAVATRSRATAERARSFIGAGEATTDLVRAAASADIVFITTPDGAIRSVCEAIATARGFRTGSLAVHTSGAHTMDLLDAAKSAGAHRAVVHPLQSVPSMDLGVKNLPGSYFRIEADPEAADIARELVSALGGTELAMPKWRPDRHSAALYHAGAVTVSNYLVALIDYGLRFYRTLGADRQDALKAVLPLIKGTLGNIEKLGTTAALTGPLARGDAETIAGHLAAMRERAPELLDPYRELAKLTIAVAREKGSITEQAVYELLTLLEAENGPLL